MTAQRLLRALIVCCVGAWFGPTLVLAEGRVALVIGNSAYRTVTALPNPANDAKAMVGLLTSAGFEITEAPDLSQSDMRRAIRDFAAKIAEKGPDTVALVFYAGHGVQVDGENYLVPVDAKIEREADLSIEAVRLADVMNALNSVPSKARIVILDACRNNPFSEIVKNTGRGLAIVDAPRGSFVSYSTAPGAVAADGAGQNSPFTTALIEVARTPGLPIELAFRQVRTNVDKATNGGQTPWDSSSLVGDFTFFPGAPNAAPAESTATAPGNEPRTAQPVAFWKQRMTRRTPAEAFDIVLRADVVEAYEAYLEIYETSPLVPRVRVILERRQEMIAWFNTTNANTVLAFEAFLARYPNSDLSPSARRMMERAQSRSAFASASPSRSIQAAVSQPAPEPVVRIVEKIVERPVIREVERIVERPVVRIVEKPVERIVEKIVEKVVYSCPPGRQPEGRPQRPPPEGRPHRPPYGSNRPMQHRPVQNYPRGNRYPPPYVR